MNELLFDQTNKVGHITLNRPKALNALSLNMLLALKEQLISWHSDPNILAITINSSNDKAFCAGGDIKAIYHFARDDLTATKQFFHDEYCFNYYFAAYPKPIIPLLDGITMGGGVGISMHSKYCLATENAIFAMPETAIGFFPDIGASFLLNRSPGNIGMYLGLTGSRLTAADCLYCGLVKRIIAKEQLTNFLDKLTNLNTIDDRSLTKLFQDFAISLPPKINSLQNSIDNCFNASSVNGIFNNLEQAQTSWAKDTLATLHKKSPTSLAVTFQQLKKTRNKSLAECLQLDYTLAKKFLHIDEFYNGIKAVLIDKSNAPTWEPASLALIQSHYIAGFFENEEDQLQLG